MSLDRLKARQLYVINRIQGCANVFPRTVAWLLLYCVKLLEQRGWIGPGRIAKLLPRVPGSFLDFHAAFRALQGRARVICRTF